MMPIWAILSSVSAFYFEWPWALLLLALIPLGWIYGLRRRKRWIEQAALTFSYASVAARLSHKIPAWKRLLMPVMATFLATSLILSIARPTVVAKIPVNSVDMMIVLDISLSMLADDMPPDRMTAAREAAIRFVDSLPGDVRVGLELFAGGSYVVSPPTSRHGEVSAALRALRKEDLRLRTEIGSAIHAALGVLNRESAQAALDKEKRAQSPMRDTSASGAGGAGSSTSDGQTPREGARDEDGKRPPDRVIVLLSDGDSHEGYPWDRAAREAREAGVMIHTVGIGSAEGGEITYQGMRLPVNFSEETLRQIAAIAGGNYFRVFEESDFRKAYEQIRARTVHTEERAIDTGFVLAALGLLLMTAMILARRF